MPAELTYCVATTLDGFIADAEGGIDFFPTAGDHLAALAEEFPETFPAPFRESLGIAGAANRHFDTVVMGRRTYEPALTAGLTSPYPHLDQHVVSTTLGSVDDPAITVIDSDPVASVRQLKGEDRQGIWLCGGGELAAALIEEIDELILKVNPVVIGRGTPLIAGDVGPRGLAPGDVVPYGSGVTVHRYRREAPA